MKRILRIPVFTTMLIWALIGATFWVGCPPASWAMLAPAVSDSGPALSGEVPFLKDAARIGDLRIVQQALESRIVQQRLEDWGLTAEEVQVRLARLSDDDLHQMATEIDQVMPGGDAGLGILIALLLVAIIIVLVLYLTGNKVVVDKK